MSHFTVLVVGNDHEAALQPFHEFECTGMNDQYVADVDQTDEVKEELASFLKEAAEKGEVATGDSLDAFFDYYGYNRLDGDAEPDTDGEHKYGYVRVQDGQIVRAIRRTNPNKKWDWYQVGGRWSGMLLLKKGANGNYGDKSWVNKDKPDDMDYCDQARAGDVDWDSMIGKAGHDAGVLWQKVRDAVGDQKVVFWSDFLAKVKAQELTIEQAREQYHAQPAVKATTEILGWWDAAESLQQIMTTSSADYTRRMGMESSRTYALLHEGQWIAPGDMGWWGMSSDTDESNLDFTAKYWEVVKVLPADTLVTVVDCHI